MGVNVDKARNDRFARHVNFLDCRRSGDFARRSNSGDAVVGYKNVALFKDLVPAHRDDAGAGQEYRAGRFVSGCRDGDVVRLGLVLGHRLPVEFGAPRPCDRLAVACPIKVIAAVNGHFLDRYARCRRSEAHVDCLAARTRHGDDVMLAL